jgi:uncharacterized phage protein (TIGR01671 family)
MREIKVRAYHRVEEGEWDEVADDWKYQMNYDLAFEYYEPINDLLNQVENVMQFTGLKDKNRKEIFEGDVVNAVELGIDDNFCKTQEIFSQRIAEVYWDELIAGWGLRAESFERGCVPMCHLDEFEVIGNIYENPELLNKVMEPQERDARKAEQSGDVGSKTI